MGAAAEPWQGVLSSFGTRLYKEYGRHESLQSCVRKHKEAGCKSPKDLGALEWLLLHHTPEVAEREDKDPLDVLLTTVLLGCCDVEQFIRAVVRCLEDDPALEGRLQMALSKFDEYLWESYQTSHMLEVYIYVTLCDVCGWDRVRVCFQACTLSVFLLIVTCLYRRPSATMHCICDLSSYVGPNYRAP